MVSELTPAQRKIIKALKQLERDWPKDGTMLMAGTGFLRLCTKHPEAGGKEIEAFSIPSDGGDPSWSDQ